MALNPPLCVLKFNPGQDRIVHPRKVSAFVRGENPVSALLPWTGLPPVLSANHLLLSQLFPPFPCCWLEELLLIWLISIPSKIWLETHLIIHHVIFLSVSKTHGKGGKEKFKTETSFPL